MGESRVRMKFTLSVGSPSFLADLKRELLSKAYFAIIRESRNNFKPTRMKKGILREILTYG
jgi:hypothetical protein